MDGDLAVAALSFAILDCGYDISDYTESPLNMARWAIFSNFWTAPTPAACAVILDLVLNHTSDQHPWFIESSSSRDNPKRDWYIWRDGKNGGPPNNWCSCFDGDAWQFDARTGQYYYHYFLTQQPDLNWRNPEVKRAMFDAVRFWLRLGVDGFRLDAIGTITNTRSARSPGPILDRVAAGVYQCKNPPRVRSAGKSMASIISIPDRSTRST